MYKVMTAGPVQVRENVREARALECTNPDLDMDFFDFYKETCELFEMAMHATDHQALILGGEGILGLEAACASLTEPGDRVLVIDNGIFGEGFKDFVSMYGGEPVLYTTDYHKPVDVAELAAFLEKDHDFKYATVVHCDTPSGVLNDVETISRMLAEHGIMSVVDSVAGMFGEPLDLSNASIDILCGGSQKALSAPPGLTMLWVSKKAYASMEARKTPIAAFYANILMYKDYYENKLFPYTMPISDINGLRQALDNYFEEAASIYERHAAIASACRTAISEAGLELYLEDGFSNTVTVVNIPDGITDEELRGELMRDHNIIISGSYGCLAGKVVRIGHMGENAYEDKVAEVLTALAKVLTKHDILLKCDMEKRFREVLA